MKPPDNERAAPEPHIADLTRRLEALEVKLSSRSGSRDAVGASWNLPLPNAGPVTRKAVTTGLPMFAGLPRWSR